MRERPVAETVEFLEGIYDKWLNDRKSDPGKRPFYQGIKRVIKHLGVVDYLWSNVLPCDHDKKPPQDALRDWLLRFHVLSAQISILQPTAVLFLSGPYRDNVIRQLFGDVEFKPFKDKMVSQLAKLSGVAKLPSETYRTYHPA